MKHLPTSMKVYTNVSETPKKGDPPLLIMSRKLLTRRPAMMFYNRLMSWKIRKEIRHCIIYHNALLG